MGRLSELQRVKRCRFLLARPGSHRREDHFSGEPTPTGADNAPSDARPTAGIDPMPANPIFPR